MSGSKPRSDSVLKTLPADRQAAIFEMMCPTLPGQKAMSYAAIRAELAKDGLKVSQSTLSEFRSYYMLKETFREAEQDSLQIVELLKKEFPEVDQDKVTAFGSAYFNQVALKKQDPELFLAVATAQHKATMDKAKLALRKQEIELSARRVKLLEQKAAQADAAATTLKDGSLSAAEQQQRLKQIFGMGN